MSEPQDLGGRLKAGTGPEDLISDQLRAHLVEEAMTRPACSVRPDTSLKSAVEVMRTKRISGFPVVGDDGRVVGVLSEKDVVRELDRATGVGRARGLLDLLLAALGPAGPELLEVCRKRLQSAKVEDAMSRRPVVVETNATLGEAVHLMTQYSVNRLPVLDADGHLVGVVTRQDVVRTAGPATPGPRRAKRGP